MAFVAGYFFILVILVTRNTQGWSPAPDEACAWLHYKLPAAHCWHNAMKAAHRYAVKVSDTTMMPIAFSSPGH